MKKIIALILSVFSMGMYAADDIPLRANANALIEAAERGDSDGCEKLIDAGVDVNCGLMAKPIHGAARNGHEDCVRFLISKGALVGGGFPAPLSSAALCKRVSVMRILLEHGARPDNDYQYPACSDIPLHVATLVNCVPALELLKEFGATLTIQDSNGLSALHVAMINNSYHAAEWLIKNKLDVNAKAHKSLDLTPLQYAATTVALRGDMSCYHLCVKNGADPTELNEKIGKTAAQLCMMRE